VELLVNKKKKISLFLSRKNVCYPTLWIRPIVSLCVSLAGGYQLSDTVQPLFRFFSGFKNFQAQKNPA